MTTPTTATGKSLLAIADSFHWTSEDSGIAVNIPGLRRHILAIEAQAIAAERQRISAAVEKLEHSSCVAFDDAQVIERAAVLAIVKEPQP